MKVTTIKDSDTLTSVCADLEQAPYVSFDVETQADEGSNLEDWHPSSRVVSASFTWGEDLAEPARTAVVPLAHPASPWYAQDEPKRDGGWVEVLRELARSMLHCKMIAQNAKYDVRWTYSMTGIALEERVWFDPMSASYALDENLPKNLGALCETYLGIPSWKGMVDLRRADRAPWRDLASYNARDTINTYRLVAPMLEDLKEDPRVARIHHYILMPIARELIKIERRGLRPDLQRLQQRSNASEEALEIASRNLLAYAERFLGDDLDETEINWNANSNFFKAFMARSGAPVYEHTRTGQPSWNKNVLKRLASEGVEYVAHLLSYREHEKDLSFLRSWEEHARFDGRIHPTYNPTRYINAEDQQKGTVTGRLSSSNPNAQQIPKRLKSVFAAEPGWLFVEADYAQIELRIAAMVFREPSMLDAFERGDDLHTLFAADLTGKEPDQISETERFYAKAGNFGFLYGMGSSGFVEYAFNTYGLEVSILEAQKIRDRFFKRWSKLSEGHERVIDLARNKGYATSPLGRIRRVPDITSSNEYLRARAERQAINAVVQSTASDLMLLTIIDLGRTLDTEQARVVGTVHDSILLEVRKEHAKKVLTQVANTMLYPDTRRRFGVEITVPLTVEFQVGRRWADEKAQVLRKGV